MLKKLKYSVDILKKRVLDNLDLIHENESIIREILKEPVSKERSEKLNRQFSLSKNLLKENTDAIKLQKEINNYIENYYIDLVEYSQKSETEKRLQEKSKEKETFELSKDEYFDITIHGEIIFDSHHPYLKDEDFINRLLSHFISTENYEVCSQLLGLDNPKNLSEK